MVRMRDPLVDMMDMMLDVIDVMDVIAGSTGQTGEDCSSSGAPGRIMLHPSHLVEVY